MARNRIERAVSIGIYADSTQARTEMRQLGRILFSVKDPTEKLDRAMWDLTQRYASGEVQLEKYREAEQRLIVQHDKEVKAVDKVRQKYKELTDTWAAGMSKMQAKKASQASWNAGLAKMAEATERASAAMLHNLQIMTGWSNAANNAAAGAAAWSAGMDSIVAKRSQQESWNAGMREMAAVTERANAALLKNAALLSGWSNTASKAGGAMWASGMSNLQKQQQARAANAAAWAGGMANMSSVARNKRIMAGLGQIDHNAFASQIRNAQRAGQAYLPTLHQVAIKSQIARQRTEQLRASFGKLGSSLQSTTLGLAATVVGPLVVLYETFRGLKKAIDLSAELEAAEADFRVFTGSLEKSKHLLTEIRELSTKGVGFSVGQRATSTMLQFGDSAYRVLTHLRQIAEVTGGDSQRMESMGLAIGQVIAAGRLMGQENIQLVNAGFPAQKLLAERLKTDTATIKKMTEEGAISAELLLDVLREATSRGGRYFGRLEERAKTLRGQFNMLTAEAEKFGTAFGDFIKPEVLGQSKELTGVLGNLTTILNHLSQTRNAVAESQFVDDIWFLKFLPTPGALTNFLSGRAKAWADNINNANRWGNLMGKPTVDAKMALTDAERLAEMRKRARETFDKPLGNAKDAVIEARYLKFAEQVKLLRDQSVDTERKTIDNLIQQGASVREIYMAANETARAEADKLTILQRQAEQLERQQKAAEKLREARERFQEKAEEIRRSLNKNADFIDQRAQIEASFERGLLTKAEAQQAMGNLLDRSVQNNSLGSGAAGGAMRGSAAAFQQMRNQQINGMDKQLKESQKHTLLLETQVESGERRKELLEELVETKPITLD